MPELISVLLSREQIKFLVAVLTDGGNDPKKSIMDQTRLDLQNALSLNHFRVGE